MKNAAGRDGMWNWKLVENVKFEKRKRSRSKYREDRGTLVIEGCKWDWCYCPDGLELV